jgi:eukaryotic-like serine/threonine-protein kinase
MQGGGEPRTLTSPEHREPPPPSDDHAHHGPRRHLAFNREMAIRGPERSASVRRLKQAVMIGLVAWAASSFLDWWVTSFSGFGSLGTVLLLRSVGLLGGLVVLARLRRPTRPSLRLVRLMDAGLFTLLSVLGSIMCVHLGGIASPCATGIVLILIARGTTVFDQWRSGIWLFGVPALSFPVVMLAATCIYSDISAQLSDPKQLGLFGTSVGVIVTTWMLLTIGGNFVWRLRREALEARTIGRYKLERRLGRGGMGDVWAAYDARLKKRVAVKILRAHKNNRSAVVRFEREVRALAGLAHPNIVKASDYGVTDEGIWYYAMELLDGQSLGELVRAEGPLEPQRLISIAIQVADALTEAHARGVIHRDIKPDNIFITPRRGEAEVVKLLDFGVAQTSSVDEATLTATGWVAGTPGYMSPEALCGRQVDARSDVYALGATLYLALAGTQPFDLESEASIEAPLSRRPSALAGTPDRPIPDVLVKVIQRCLERDPGARYHTSRALLSALEGARDALSR